MPPSLNELSGLGYSGYARVGGQDLLLLPSSAEERENFIQTRDVVSTNPANATGHVPVRDRRSLQLSLTAQLTPNSLRAFTNTTLAWRGSGALNGASPALAIFSHGEGYSTTEAYVDSATLSLPEGGLGTVSFQMTAWIWQDVAGTGNYLTQDGTGFNPSGADHQPIPSWLTSVTHSGHPGVPIAWSFSLSNNYNYIQLLEGALFAPNPRVVIPGPLEADLSLTTLAQPGFRPLESGSGTLSLGGGQAGMFSVPAFNLALPFMVRDPARQIVGFGESNSVIRWDASWKSLGVTPG